MMSFLNGSSGFITRGNGAENAPSCSMFQFFMSMPFGPYGNASRTGGVALDAPNTFAGTIASRYGSATAAPRPRRKVRRGRDLPVRMPIRLLDPQAGASKVE